VSTVSPSAEVLDTLPVFLIELLNNPPSAGSGLHQWIFKCACHLHIHLSEAETFELIKSKAAGCGRPMDRLEKEIWSTIRSARAYMWLPDFSDRYALRQERVRAFSALVRRSLK
jgi:hypothetical protein